MIKMAAMHIYGKNPSELIFSGTDRRITKKLGMYEGVSKSSCTNAISFLWHKIPYQIFVMCKTDMCLACVQSFSKLRQNITNL